MNDKKHDIEKIAEKAAWLILAFVCIGILFIILSIVLSISFLTYTGICFVALAHIGIVIYLLAEFYFHE